MCRNLCAAIYVQPVTACNSLLHFRCNKLPLTCNIQGVKIATKVKEEINRNRTKKATFGCQKPSIFYNGGQTALG
jgi:hypothetical protein